MSAFFGEGIAIKGILRVMKSLCVFITRKIPFFFQAGEARNLEKAPAADISKLHFLKYQPILNL